MICELRQSRRPDLGKALEALEQCLGYVYAPRRCLANCGKRERESKGNRECCCCCYGHGSTHPFHPSIHPASNQSNTDRLSVLELGHLRSLPPSSIKTTFLTSNYDCPFCTLLHPISHERLVTSKAARRIAFGNAEFGIATHSTSTTQKSQPIRSTKTACAWPDLSKATLL